MKTQWMLLVGLGALLALLCGCLAADDQQQVPSAEQAEREAAAFNGSLRADFKLPKMFDFERFKSAFKRHFSSALEEMVRAKLFMARAYRAFITAVKYKYRTAKFYLAINSRTDWTHEELQAALNHAVIPDDDDDDDDDAPEVQQLKPGEQQPERQHIEPLVDPADVEAELRRIHENRHEAGYEQLDEELSKMQPGAQSRRKRETKSAVARRRKLPRADFQLSEAYEREKGANKGTLGARVPSNNPNYQQPDVASEMSLKELSELPGWREVWSRDIRYGQKVRKYHNLPVKSKYTTRNKPYLMSLTQGFVSAVRRWRRVGPSSKEEPTARRSQDSDSHGDEDHDTEDDTMDEDKPDLVWVDHRQGGCMQPVQDQGHCGSCYAFASMAFLEWAHCQETGSPVKFSEQYIVDCATRIDHVHGCGGAFVDMMATFVHNYGLELAQFYPYKAREEQCPYDNSTEPKSMGYMRVDSTSIVRIPIELVEEYLAQMPLMININTAGDFHFYGGGIFDGAKCEKRGNHAVLLIGHGREDGEEYWLIRNSHSTDYGEQGHLRLNKNSDCIHPRRAQAFGNLHRGRIRIYSQRNWRVPTPVQKTANAPSTGSKRKNTQDEAFRMEMEMAKRREAERQKRNQLA